MKTSIHSLLFTLLLSGCAGVSRVATDTVAASAVGLTAHQLSKGDPLATAVGTGAGLLLGETLNYANDAHAKKAYTNGFDKGRSDAVKQQYWIMVNQQKSRDFIGENIDLLDLPLLQSPSDGALFNSPGKMSGIGQ